MSQLKACSWCTVSWICSGALCKCALKYVLTSHVHESLILHVMLSLLAVHAR